MADKILTISKIYKNCNKTFEKKWFSFSTIFQLFGWINLKQNLLKNLFKWEKKNLKTYTYFTSVCMCFFKSLMNHIIFLFLKKGRYVIFLKWKILKFFQTKHISVHSELKCINNVGNLGMRKCQKIYVCVIPHSKDEYFHYSTSPF